MSIALKKGRFYGDDNKNWDNSTIHCFLVEKFPSSPRNVRFFRKNGNISGI